MDARFLPGRAYVLLTPQIVVNAHYLREEGTAWNHHCGPLALLVGITERPGPWPAPPAWI
jgi:hypothetical protein